MISERISGRSQMFGKSKERKRKSHVWIRVGAESIVFAIFLLIWNFA